MDESLYSYVHNYIKYHSNRRWLLSEELYLLLICDLSLIGYNFSIKIPQLPKNGSLYIYQSEKPYFTITNDHINWIKKKGSIRLQETFQKIRLNGIHNICTDICINYIDIYYIIYYFNHIVIYYKNHREQYKVFLSN